MLDKFLLHPPSNTLAVIVLCALIVSWFTSILLALRDVPISLNRRGYAAMILGFSLLSIPALFDLLQTSGIAFVLALIATLVILISIAALIMQLAGKQSFPLVKDWSKWAVPILVVGGLAVAGYFVFLEVTGGPVLCGPTQGCDTVQNSKYATLFGFVPMGIFGLVGYLAILAGWLLGHYGPVSWRKLGILSMWGCCIFGVLFSIYLTFLEPFVIGATCMWCITSAVLMIALLLISTPAAQQELAIPEE
jgi:uncharacterized membrane protein